MVMDLLLQEKAEGIPNLGHQIRHLKWFRKTFHKSSELIASHYALTFQIDEEALARVFFDWIDRLESTKHHAEIDRKDFIKFAGGLVLKELVRINPARLTADPPPGLPEVAAFWPEGFLYTNYCISIVSAVHEQEYGERLELSDSVDDLRTWTSFRENVQEMPAYAIAFLDRFFGNEPNWTMPEIPEYRAAMLKVVLQREQRELQHGDEPAR